MTEGPALGDGYTKIGMHLIPLNCTLKNGKGSKYIFYHNKKNLKKSKWAGLS